MRTTLAPLLCGVALLMTPAARANDEARQTRPPATAGRSVRPLGGHRTTVPATGQGLDVARRIPETRQVRPLGGAAQSSTTGTGTPNKLVPQKQPRAVAPALIPAAERTAARQQAARARVEQAEQVRSTATGEVAEAQREAGELERRLEALDSESSANATEQRTARQEQTRAAQERQRLANRGFFRRVFDWFDFTRSHARAMEAAELRESAASERVADLGKASKRIARELPTTRERAQQARARVTDIEARLAELDREASAAATDADEADRELDREIAEYERSTRLDQSVVGAPESVRAAHARATARFDMRSALVSKPGEISQDAYATNPAEGRFAVADGVTNSRFSGEFARVLVRMWAESPPARGQSFAEWLRPAQEAWGQLVAPARAALERQWFNRGASWVGHSTFAAVAFEGGRMRAMGLGDALIVVVRNGRVVKAWPNERAADFSNETQALPSSGDLLWEPQEADLDVEPGDEVFMMSDAIGSWTLRESEAGRDPFSILRDLDRPERLQSFVDARRQHDPNGNLLDVDDTTLVRFVVPSGR